MIYENSLKRTGNVQDDLRELVEEIWVMYRMIYEKSLRRSGRCTG
jgi:hypothetical protein